MFYKREVNKDINEVSHKIQEAFANMNLSSSLEDSVKEVVDSKLVELMIFERFSMFGSNRVSLSVMLIGDAYTTKIFMKASGGSQGALLKINTFSESSFLNKAIKKLDSIL